jgi:3',5'-cyclic AMP phosphodiesterase CpdA
VKIVHLTDIHVHVRPALGDLLGKRLIGSTNLYVLGREGHFSAASQRAAVEATVAESPDVVVITGDLTAQALDTEFEAARALLAPVLDRFPTVIIPGNHDVYVPEPTPAQAMRRHFGRWMGDDTPWLHTFDDVAFLAIETCRPHLLSSGKTPAGQLEAARALLDRAGDRFVFQIQHYPLRNRHGAPYGPSTRALVDARQVEAFLAETDRVGAVLHGHEHHGFRTEVETAAGPVPILDPGASGYAHLPDKGRTAHLNIYEADRGGLYEVRRLRFDGAAFVPEPGGAYATGG